MNKRQNKLRGLEIASHADIRRVSSCVLATRMLGGLNDEPKERRCGRLMQREHKDNTLGVPLQFT